MFRHKILSLLGMVRNDFGTQSNGRTKVGLCFPKAQMALLQSTEDRVKGLNSCCNAMIFQSLGTA